MNSDSHGTAGQRLRARELLADQLGLLPSGPQNSITDVNGVLVGHHTLSYGDTIRTGVTAVKPHNGNLYQERVPAGLSVANGFGKLIGATQVEELGELETPILLTNTLAAPRAADALIQWTLKQQGNEHVVTVNPFVGETNDSKLNDIRNPAVQAEHVFAALEAADSGPVAEGAVGAGTGTVAFGFKGGMGTSSRVLPEHLGGYTVGALVQSNYGGVLSVAGLPVGQQLNSDGALNRQLNLESADGSIMIVLATDAPLSDRNLKRLAARGHAGLARTGSSFSNGSGDYCVAFSVAQEVRRSTGTSTSALGLGNSETSPLFLAAIESVEEAILNSLFMAVDVVGFRGHTVSAVPLSLIRNLRAAQRK